MRYGLSQARIETGGAPPELGAEPVPLVEPVPLIDPVPVPPEFPFIAPPELALPPPPLSASCTVSFRSSTWHPMAASRMKPAQAVTRTDERRRKESISFAAQGKTAPSVIGRQHAARKCRW